VESPSFCRGAVENVHQAAALSQAAQGLKTSFHGQAFVDHKAHSLRIASRPQSFAKPPDFPGFKQKIRSRQCHSTHGSFPQVCNF
jgi:hypothetical protein